MPNSEFSLHGRVALITGAGRGIGLSIGRLLAKHGCAVALQDIEQDVADTATQEIVADGGRALALGGDILDLNLPRQLVESTREELGGLHILINNAAIQEDRHWLKLAPEQVERIWRANMLSPLLLSQLAVPIFLEQRWGRIINLGSIQGKMGNPMMLPYSMGKAALINMTMALARELAPDGITVNALAPGYINTWRNRDQFQTPEDFETRAKWIPAKRVGNPEDCAGLALLLCSDEGRYITGQTIYVDGGISVR